MPHLETLRSLYEARQFDDAWPLYLGSPPEGPEWHLYGSLIAWRTNNWFGARTAIERAFQTRVRLDPDLETKIRFQHGVVLLEFMECGEAVEEFRLCLKAMNRSRRLGPVTRGHCWMWMGYACGGMGLASEARDYYWLALQRFREEGMTDSKRMCLQNLAWIEVDLGRFDAATALLEQAEPHCTSTDAQWKQRLVYMYIANLTGDYNEVARLGRMALEAHTAGEVADDICGFAEAIAADSSLRQGNIDGALYLSALAVTHTNKPQLDLRAFRYAGMLYQRALTAKHQKETGA